MGRNYTYLVLSEDGGYNNDNLLAERTLLPRVVERKRSSLSRLPPLALKIIKFYLI